MPSGGELMEAETSTGLDGSFRYIDSRIEYYAQSRMDGFREITGELDRIRQALYRIKISRNNYVRRMLATGKRGEGQ